MQPLLFHPPGKSRCSLSLSSTRPTAVTQISTANLSMLSGLISTRLMGFARKGIMQAYMVTIATAKRSFLLVSVLSLQREG